MFGRTGQIPDLGHEPPLDTAGANAEIIDRREVSLRWLGASILVGITGGALIGASVYIAFQGFASLVELPRKAHNAAYTSTQDDADAPAVVKGDQILRQNTATATSKGSLKMPVTIKLGNREIIKVRQFIRVSTTLSPTVGLYASNIPPFNPVKLMSEGDETLAATEPAEVTDADVSLTRTALANLVFDDDQQSLSDSDAQAQLEAERALLQRGQHSGLPISPQFLLSKPLPKLGDVADIDGQGTPGTTSLFSGIEVRVIPENVTNIVKDDTIPMEEGDKEYALKRGETLQAFLASRGASPVEIESILAALDKSTKVAALGEGQKVRLLTDADIRRGGSSQILRVSLANDKATTAIAALSDRGGYVAVLPQNDPAPNAEQSVQLAKKQSKKPSSDDDEDEDRNEKLGTARIYDSLYETAAKNTMPTGMVDEIVRVFGSDVDFQRRVSANDTIDILYSTEEDGSDKPEMLYASFTVGGETRKIYRYQSDEGSIDYLDADGRSLRRFLLRKPITDAILRSGFGMRRHPVLGYSKLHSGVDWANKIGTPILAAGNGTVVYAGWKSGYGNHIEIQHANGYVTTYSHQSRFAAISTIGARVRQGQVIGYVGNTGLSTGPHLHYEVLVNGSFVDPMKIRVPRGKELSGATLAEFKRQRDQVDTILARADSGLAVARGGSN